VPYLPEREKKISRYDPTRETFWRRNTGGAVSATFMLVGLPRWN
jgi:hypothetical protein